MGDLEAPIDPLSPRSVTHDERLVASWEEGEGDYQSAGRRRGRGGRAAVPAVGVVLEKCFLDESDDVDSLLIGSEMGDDGGEILGASGEWQEVAMTETDP